MSNCPCRSLGMNKDLTVGKPSKVLWQFCIALFGSVLFQQLYNLADSFVAGKFIGKDALAAVGNSYEITLIFIAFSFGCNIGCSVVVSQLFGAKKIGQLKTAVYTTLIAGGVLCAALMAVGFLGGKWLLTLIHTPMEIFTDSKLYLDIYVLGLPFLLFYNVATGVFSALGDSKTPFWFLACSSTANIGVDIWFVAKLKMGVAGVAWATFICQGVSCVLAVFFVMRRLKGMKAEEKPEAFSFAILKRIAAIAVPSILQQSFISVGNIIIQSVVNSFGASTIAGYAAAVKLNNMVVTSFTTLGNGISNFTAQNLGAAKYDRIKSGFIAGVKMVLGLAVSVSLLYVIGAKWLIGLFLDVPTAEVVDAGTKFLWIIAPFYFTVAVKLVSDGVLRGAGRMRQFMTDTFTDLILRVVLVEILSRTVLGSTGIWLSWPLGWIAGTVVSLFFYKHIPVLRDTRRNGDKTSHTER